MSKEKGNLSFVQMPETMHMDEAETQEREKVNNSLQSLISYINKLREKGISIKSESDLRKFTPSYVKEQISASRKRRLEDSPFLPIAIRRNEEREFDNMEAELTALAESLQSILGKVEFPFTVGEKAEETFFDSDKVEEYINRKSSIAIPEKVRQYYVELQKICKAWQDLCKWTEENNINPPTMGVARRMIHEERFALVGSGLSEKESCIMSLSPEDMFKLFVWGNIKQL